MKRITLCICMCSPSTSCRFSASLIQNIDKFGAEKYFIVHRKANAIQLFAPIKMIFFGSLLFQSKSQWRRISQGLLDKYSHPFICISLKWILSSGGKPVYTVKILISDQIAFAVVLYFGQVFVFYRLINRSVLGWFLLCK